MRLSNWKIASKILLVIAVLSATTLVVGTIGYLNIGKLDRAARQIDDVNNQALAGGKAAHSITQMNRGEYRVAAEPTMERIRDARTSLVKRQEAFEKALATMKANADPEQARLVAEIEREYQTYMQCRRMPRRTRRLNPWSVRSC
jgi:methyl-accepting chemotaxis protein